MCNCEEVCVVYEEMLKAEKKINDEVNAKLEIFKRAYNNSLEIEKSLKNKIRELEENVRYYKEKTIYYSGLFNEGRSD
jgi:cell division septum initiation protein DivIVA